MLNLKQKVELLNRDYGLEYLLLQNDIEEEDVIIMLIEHGLIDLDEYFYTDTDEAIWLDED